MDFVSTRIITADVARLVAFYERVTGVEATWATEDFADLVTAHGTLAIASERTVPLFAEGSARAAANHSAVIEFLVDDVDRVHKELADVVGEFVNGPATMPWATGPCSSVTPTATWSTSSPPTPRPPSRGSPGDEAARRSRRRTPARLAPPRRGHPGVRPAVRTSPQVHGASAPHPGTPRHRTFPRTGRPVAGTALVGPPRRITPEPSPRKTTREGIHDGNRAQRGTRPPCRR